MEEDKKSQWHSKKEKLKKSNSRKCHNVYLYYQQMEYALFFYCLLFCYVIFFF